MARSPILATFAATRLLALALFGLVPSLARAQAPSSADRATARKLAQEGYEALRAQEYATAADRFARANELVRAPTLMRDLARAQVGLGHLVDAHELYRQIVREGLAPGAPAPWGPAIEDAKKELAELEPRIPWMTITVAGPAHPRVTIDGAPIAESSLGVKRPVDPGTHELRALARGYHTAKKTISVKEGDELSVAFELEESPPDAAPKNEEAGKVSVASVEEPGWVKPLTIGAFSVGAAGVVVGSVTGIMALTKRSQLARDCDNGVCGPDEKAAYDDFHSLGAISTISFVAGGMGLGAGVVLLLVEPKILVEQAPSGRARAPGGVSFSPFVGAGSAGVRGTF